jgi:hypothetical protein
MVQVPFYQIVHVVPMHHLFISAARPMNLCRWIPAALVVWRAAVVFAATPLAILQPRTAIAYRIAPATALRTGFGLFGDILPGSVADTIGYNPPYVKNFQGGLVGTVEGSAIAPELARQYGPCDYDVRQNLTATSVYRVLGLVAKG